MFENSLVNFFENRIGLMTFYFQFCHLSDLFLKSLFSLILSEIKNNPTAGCTFEMFRNE